MGASSASTQSNTNTISVTHEYTIGRFVCGCFSPYSFSFSFSLLFFFFFLWASLSSFLVASEEALVVPTTTTTTTGIYNTSTSSSSSSSTTSGTAFLSPTPPAKSHLNTSGSSSSKHHSRVDLKIGLVVGVSLFLFFSGVVFVAVIIMGCFPRRFRFVNTRRRHGSEKVVAHEYDEEEEGSNRDSYCKDHGENDCGGIGGTRDACRTRRRFTWGEVEKFTCNFSSVIGSGGFSTVYLAQFPNSKALAAIKIHCSSSERLNRVFKQEMEILMGLEHDNIVKFLGYCDEREEGGVLVFEYVPGGNLQEKLHNHKRERGSKNATAAVLPWKSRMKIAYQLAQAVEYLHEKCPLQIVHGDIKSSNILLDEQLNCKLCDFGSAKMGFSSTVLPPSSYTRANRMMMGSPGYTDPHYLRTGIASKKNDVYSFGVILLELITGKEALCSQNGERLTSIVGPLLKDESRVAETLVDARLGGAGGVDLEEVKTMAALAAMCLSDSATSRPSASDIVHIMSTQISTFLPSANVDKKF